MAERTPQTKGPSVTSDRRGPLEVFEEQARALREIPPDELAAFVGSTADQTRTGRAEAREAAAWRKEMGRRRN